MTDRWYKGIDGELKRYYESTRRKELERQVQESVQQPVKQDLEELIRLLKEMSFRLNDYMLKTLTVVEGTREVEKQQVKLTKELIESLDILVRHFRR